MASCSRQGSVLCPLSLVTKIHDIPETAKKIVIIISFLNMSNLQEIYNNDDCWIRQLWRENQLTTYVVRTIIRNSNQSFEI